MPILTIDDLPASVRDTLEPGIAHILIAGANARAIHIAPCLNDAPTDDQLAEARLVLVGAIKRWTEAGSGAVSQQTAGPFGMTVDTRQRGGWNLWPTEINQLQTLCATETSRAYTIDTIPVRTNPHITNCPASTNAAAPCTCAATWIA